MYIYKFTHIESNKSYIGQTIQDPNQRRLEHISDSRHTTKEYHFHNAIRKYGIDSFTFEVIAEANSLAELNLLEEKFVVQYDSINNGYNIRQAGGNKLHSEESKERMRIAQRAAHARRRAEGRDTFTKTRKTSGWKWTDEQKENLKDNAILVSRLLSNKTWKVIDGKRVWLDKGASV
jgi:group I intron endonuclease